jgi:CheY-like chemotaxis protein
VETVDFNLRDLLEDLHTMMVLKAQSKSLALNLEISPDVPEWVNSDQRKFRQIVINLLGNAIKFTDRGHITLRLTIGRSETIDRILCCEVLDTGHGIAPHEMSQVFEAFMQTSTGRNAQTGTGLGLSISRQLARIIGGDLTVTSEVNVGSQFCLTVPFKEAKSLTQNNDVATPRIIGLLPGQPTYRILIADDTLENRHLLTELLSQIGFEVREAGNGRAAILLAEQWQPQLILMDLRMPDMDGMTAMRYLRNQPLPSLNSIKILAISASTFETDVDVLKQSGFDDFLPKPFQTQTLLEKIAHHLGVQFSYAEAAAAQPVAVPQSALDIRQQIQALPKPWRSQLYEAAADLNFDPCLELIQELEPDQQQLAQILTDLVNNFRFDTLMEMMSDG